MALLRSGRSKVVFVFFFCFARRLGSDLRYLAAFALATAVRICWWRYEGRECLKGVRVENATSEDLGVAILNDLE